MRTCDVAVAGLGLMGSAAARLWSSIYCHTLAHPDISLPR
jgi:hypothetical protein